MCRHHRSQDSRHPGLPGAYFSVAVPLFVVACVLHVPFIGVLAMVTFWALPSLLRSVRRPRSVAQTAAPQALPTAPPEPESSIYAGTEYPRS